MTKSDKDADEKAFNETLKRMLDTPPKPHKGDRMDNSGENARDAGKGKGARRPSYDRRNKSQDT